MSRGFPEGFYNWDNIRNNDGGAGRHVPRWTRTQWVDRRGERERQRESRRALVTFWKLSARFQAGPLQPLSSGFPSVLPVTQASALRYRNPSSCWENTLFKGSQRSAGDDRPGESREREMGGEKKEEWRAHRQLTGGKTRKAGALKVGSKTDHLWREIIMLASRRSWKSPRCSLFLTIHLIRCPSSVKLLCTCPAYSRS